MNDLYKAISCVRQSWFGAVYDRGQQGLKRYTLTFDDGPLPGATDIILDILNEHHVKATFFIIGQNAEHTPDLLRRIDAEGHLVGNHTWSHSRLGMFRSAAYWRDEIRRTDDLINSIIGKKPLLFRPPMGLQTPSSSKAIKQAGHSNILWTLKARDGVTTTKQRILKRIIPNIDDGDILLMHDGRDAASRREIQPTIDALPEIIRAYNQQGVTPIPLDQLLGINAYASAT